MNEKPEQPELMSPAGHWPQLHAAIEAGADAVYFGLDHFSARAKVGFATEELPAVMTTLHERGVKGFVTFNTLVFDNELHRAEKAIGLIADAGVDAIIVQDTGIARLAGMIAPDLEIHGSTQMSITSAQGAELARQLGCTRVVLGRELSLVDIERIRRSTEVELEVFVHGALCVSYSGQCFSSEAWGGRSANRGKCAQACRLSYDLVVDGETRDSGSDRYLLSPGDLYAIEQIPALVRIGISCLKIEGRYKDENYVALTTAAYRKAIDAAVSVSPHDAGREKKQLEQIYSRGLGPYFIEGTNHQSVVKARAPRHRGLRVGRVECVGRDWVDVQCDHDLHAGDGLVFDAADWRSPDESEEGGNIYQVSSGENQLCRLRFGDGAVDFSRVRRGDLVWRTSDPKLLVQLKPLSRPKAIHHTRPLDVSVVARAGESLRVTGKIDRNIVVSVASKQTLSHANKRGLDQRQLEEQLGRLGGTPFHLETLEFRIEGDDNDLFLPVSQLNVLRRNLVEKLLEKRRAIGTGRGLNRRVVDRWFSEHRRVDRVPKVERARLHLLVRNSGQLDAAMTSQPDSITLDYLELYGLRPSIERIKSAGIVARVASPRILKPAEQNVVRFLLSLKCAIVVRSGGLLFDLLKLPSDELPDLIGDFSLNAANAVSANLWLENGLTGMTPTYDLNARQIEQLAKWVDPSFLEVIVFSHLPVFHTEHCVFCRFMSNGTDHTNCGHPCEKHQVAIRDQSGRSHPVMADVGCRNTVFGAEAQTSPMSMVNWLAAGISDYRLEFVHETPEQVASISNLFRQALFGGLDWMKLGAELDSVCPSGTTEGSFG